LLEGSPFRARQQHGPDGRAIRRAPFARRGLLQSGVFVHPVTGREVVAELLGTVHAVFGTPTYRLRLSEGMDTVLQFDGEVEGQTLEVAIVIRDGPDELIQELSVLMRPLPVVRLFGEEAMALLGITEADDSPPTGMKTDPE
jgi:hypothetical protein